MRSILVFISLVIFFSCESVFHEEEDGYMVIDSEQEKLDMINGIYSQLMKVYNYGYFEALCRSDDVNLYLSYNIPTKYPVLGCYYDDIYYDRTPNYDNIYHSFYKIILSANSVLPQLSEARDASIMGEFYFFRAYAYFMLARFFGTPHLVKDIDVKYNMERPGYTELYEFIEVDMLNALRLLPDTYTSARIPGETPHKGTAKALLAEIYLSWAGFPINDKSKYDKAAQFAGEVIQNAGYYGFDLLDDFADLWKVESKYNKENVFGLFYSSKDYETRNRINETYISPDFNVNQLSFYSRFKPQFKFYNTVPDNYRKKSSFNTGMYYRQEHWTPDTTIYYYMYDTFDPQVDPCKYLQEVASMKWMDTVEYKIHKGPDWWDDWAPEVTLYLFRYAQTLLTFAESRARSGILDDSTYEAVNMIRRRANNLDPYTPSDFDLQRDLMTEQFLDSVVWERAWELCSEPNGRWFDIIRLDLKDKISENRYDLEFPYEVPGIYLQDNWYFYKIPE